MASSIPHPKDFAATLSLGTAAVRDGRDDRRFLQVRGVIRFLHHNGTSPVEIHRQLISAYGPNVMDIKNVRKWCSEFSGGRTNVHDEPGRGRPSTSDEVVARVDDLVREDRRLTVREICYDSGCFQNNCRQNFKTLWDSIKCALDGYPVSLPMNTSGSVWSRPVNFCADMKKRRKSFSSLLLQGTQHGSIISPLRANKNQCSGGTQPRRESRS